MTTSQNGYPAGPDRAAIGVRTFAVPGRPEIQLPVRADVAPLFLEMARWWNAGETLADPGCWGYSFRPIRGATQLSNHASGTAIDLNAPRHPLGRTGTLGNRRDAVIAKAASLGLRSGAAYTGRKDEMHVELNVPLAQALQLVARLQSPPPAAPAAPAAPAPGRPTVRLGSKGDAVRLAQTALNHLFPTPPLLAEDGVFGARTQAAVKRLQTARHLTADGIVGPRTWAVLTG